MIIHNSEPTYQGRKRESLQNERREDDTESEQKDGIAPGERFAVAQHERDSQRASKRIGAAHPDPCDQSGVLPGNSVFATSFSAEQARQIVSTEHPGETDKDDDRNNRDRELGHARR